MNPLHPIHLACLPRVACVVGTLAVGPAAFLVTAHALAVKGLGPDGDAPCIWPDLSGERALRGCVVAAQTGLVIGEGLAVPGPELLEGWGMAGTAGQRVLPAGAGNRLVV